MGINFDQKTGWDTFWAIFSQTHLVTLDTEDKKRSKKDSEMSKKHSQQGKSFFLKSPPENRHNTRSRDGAFYFYCQPPPKELS
jgi:hypothetical protein